MFVTIGRSLWASALWLAPIVAYSMFAAIGDAPPLDYSQASYFDRTLVFLGLVGGYKILEEAYWMLSYYSHYKDNQANEHDYNCYE